MMEEHIKLMTLVGVNIRFGKPSERAPLKGKYEKGFLVTLLKEPHVGELHQGNDQWYETLEGDFVWAGAFAETAQVTKQKTARIKSADNPKAGWHLEKLGIPDLWEQGITGKGVKIAVIDTGVDFRHPGLEPAVLKQNSKDYVGEPGDPPDKVCHGTQMAGIIASRGEMKGLAPEALIISGRIIRFKDSGFTDHLLARAINDLSPQVDILSISLEKQDEAFTQTKAAINAAWQNYGAITVAATGNDSQVSEIAKIPHVLGVGSMGPQGLSGITDYGEGLDYAVPGENIHPGFIPGKPGMGTGTSAATAVLAGILALIKGCYPTEDALQIVSRLNRATSLQMIGEAHLYRIITNLKLSFDHED